MTTAGVRTTIVMVVLAVVAAACTSSPESTDSGGADTESAAPSSTASSSGSSTSASTSTATSTSAPAGSDGLGGAPTSGVAPNTTSPSTAPSVTAPEWLGTRTLPTDASGFGIALPTPDELIDRQFPTTDLLAPPGDQFEFTIGPLTGEPLALSTWSDECPVGVDELRYITVSFWGFDGSPHTGELIIHAEQAEAIVSVFAALHQARFPLEEMRVITQEDLDADPTGDSNNTGTFACRAVTGGARFSEHAFGLAIDINPFHNPYVRGPVVLPELASAYLDRDQDLVGMIGPDSIVVQAFADIGWEWGGDWNSLKDYQHFSLNNR